VQRALNKGSQRLKRHLLFTKRGTEVPRFFVANFDL
jgi:hypothetical protein